MDTSDSEYFESADEEIYSEDDIRKISQKCDKIANETQKDLINLNLVDSCKKSIEKQAFNIDTTLINVLNANESPTQSVSKKKDNLDIKNENKSMQEKKVKETDIDNNTKCEKIGSASTVNISSSETPHEIAVKSENDYLVVNKDSEEKISSEGRKKSSNNSIVKESENIHLQKGEKRTVLEKLAAVDTVKKSVNQGVDINIKKNGTVLTVKPNDQTQETTDNDDNMWENDDWEPVNYEKDVKEQDNKNKDKKPTQEKDDNNMWDNDDWEPFENVEAQKLEQPLEPTWSSWGNWGGVSSILTSATQGVSTLTTQVSQGLSTVLESSMGIPDPNELARLDKEQENIIKQDQEEFTNKSNAGFGFSNLSNFVSGVSHITKFVEQTGTKVITGGLDTLETIGKKTMEVLQDGDPGLKNKRALLKLDKEKPILSQVLRDAKEKAEKENAILQEKHSKKKMNYETLFDDYHGLVHLEALEMLSRQCDIKLQTLSENCSGVELQDLQETMDQIKELCELPDEDDDEMPTFDDIKEKLQMAVNDINVSITYDKLVSLWEDTETWLSNLKLDFCNEDEIHQEALQVLSQLTAIAMEQFHKCGELLLIKEHRSTADEADSLVQLTMTLTSLIGLVAAKFSEKLNMKHSQAGNKESTNGLITNVFFEAGNSSSYIQDAFQLLVPVLQAGAV